jgi:hypothetical protein
MRAGVHFAVRLQNPTLLLESIGYLQDVALSDNGSIVEVRVLIIIRFSV